MQCVTPRILGLEVLGFECRDSGKASHIREMLRDRFSGLSGGFEAILGWFHDCLEGYTGSEEKLRDGLGLDCFFLSYGSIFISFSPPLVDGTLSTACRTYKGSLKVDPFIELPGMVVNTILSVMAYDYPPEKLSIYLSDDGGSDLTFYAMLEAANFSKTWLPFCKKFRVEPTSPEAYFRTASEPLSDAVNVKDWLSVKILIDGRDSNAVDFEGNPLPTLVYLAREKRPQHHYHFKAGSMNALMGLIYGFLVEDIITGLNIQCKGWKSMYLSPERDGFLGVAPITLLQTLIQHKRWMDGHLHVFLSRYCLLFYGYKKIPFKLRLAYCPYNLWAANCLAMLYIVVVPCLCLLKGISLFPKVFPFAYIAFVYRAYSLNEFLWCGGTFRGWCNDQRMWLFNRTTAYFFALFETILKLLGYSQLNFVVTAKVADKEAMKRYDGELIEFGATSPMFDILATLAMLNFFGTLGALKKVILDVDEDLQVLDKFGLQIFLCFVLVTINLPVYQALFFRNDNGKMPSSVTYKSIIFAMLACTATMY
ncbi:hypothetical protein PVK06_040360 [Gossypium arboreum]|uniref:Cellulose synthase-like protein E1 n=1 Tax=Gossypium arboreum TaxID=29729 RepID=A0ABR0N810_GOSAR|nr:hypothetical protein PVK06_040360 [Gossypium arboreum]